MLTKWDRKNLHPGQEWHKFKWGNRVRWHDKFELPSNYPKDRPMHIVDRDVDAVLSMLKISRSIAAGDGRPDKYRRMADKKSNKKKRVATASTLAVPKSKRKSSKKNNISTSEQADEQVGAQPGSEKPKRKYTCGKCGGAGHNRTRCKAPPKDLSDKQPSEQTEPLPGPSMRPDIN
ncbi:hypothetical protein H4R19_006980 [Coemansia spiralis]|nr:hypothetical protein H4R19_006980 [Coemansia spiralis]